MTEQEAPTPRLFFCVAFKTFNIANFFSSIKSILAAPKIMFLDIFRISFNELMSTHLVRGNNQHAKGTGTIASAVLKLSLSYTDPFLLAEFS